MKLFKSFNTFKQFKTLEKGGGDGNNVFKAQYSSTPLLQCSPEQLLPRAPRLK
jgi:hypothetical protein